MFKVWSARYIFVLSYFFVFHLAIYRIFHYIFVLERFNTHTHTCLHGTHTHTHTYTQDGAFPVSACSIVAIANNNINMGSGGSSGKFA